MVLYCTEGGVVCLSVCCVCRLCLWSARTSRPGSTRTGRPPSLPAPYRSARAPRAKSTCEFSHSASTPSSRSAPSPGGPPTCARRKQVTHVTPRPARSTWPRSSDCAPPRDRRFACSTPGTVARTSCAASPSTTRAFPSRARPTSRYTGSSASTSCRTGCPWATRTSRAPPQPPRPQAQPLQPVLHPHSPHHSATPTEHTDHSPTRRVLLSFAQPLCTFSLCFILSLLSPSFSVSCSHSFQTLTASYFNSVSLTLLKFYCNSSNLF